MNILYIIAIFFKKVFALVLLFLIIAPNIALAASAAKSEIKIEKASTLFNTTVCDCDNDRDDINCRNQCAINKPKPQNPLTGTRLTTQVARPFPSSTMQAYPNGKDCALVTMEAIKSDGTFAKDLPLVIEKPTAVTVNGPQTTDIGSVQWCVTSTEPIQARITVKLQDFPRVQSTFQVSFKPNKNIQDITDRNSFFFDIPITFSAQIDPAMVRGLSSANFSFITNKITLQPDGTRGPTKRDNLTVALNCTKEGICSATVPASSTDIIEDRNSNFTYSYNFIDQNGSKFSKSFNGTLTVP